MLGLLCLHRETRNIIITKTVILAFCTIHFSITFSQQTNVDHYTGNIVIPKIVIPGFHCISKLE